MKKAIVVGLLAGLGAFAGVISNGSRSVAADEIRCRVNAEALLSDIAKLNRAVDADAIKKLLKAP